MKIRGMPLSRGVFQGDGLIPGIWMERKTGHFLLKTFSKNPFQGQYPTMAVSTKRPPTTKNSGFQNPARKRPKRMRISPKIMRRIPSPLATFFVIAIKAS
jgi:hypothetical protein